MKGARLKTIALDVRFRVVSGSSISIQNLCRSMTTQAPPEYRFVTVRYQDQDLIPELAGLEAIYAPDISAPLELAWNELWLPGKLRRWDIDLYHGMKQCAPLRGLGCPTVHTVDAVKRGSDDDLPLPFASRFYWGVHVCHVYKHSEHLLPVSEHVSTFLRDSLSVDPGNVTVVHNGVGEAFLEAGRLHTTGRPAGMDQPYVVCVGSVIPLKNQLAAVKALSKIAYRVPHHLVLLGREDTAYGQRVRKAARDGGIKDRVHWGGFVDERGLIEYLCGAELLVHVSRTEGFCLATGEAMACGLPVVASDRGALREQMGDAALYIDDPDDHDGLAEQMQRVLTEPDQRERMRQRGLARATELSWHASAQKVLGVYSTLLSDNPKERP